MASLKVQAYVSWVVGRISMSTLFQVPPTRDSATLTCASTLTSLLLEGLQRALRIARVQSNVHVVKEGKSTV